MAEQEKDQESSKGFFAAVAAKGKETLDQIVEDLSVTANAYGRAGLKDIQNAVVHAFPDSRQQADVYGLAGSPTPQEIAGTVHGKDEPTQPAAEQAEPAQAVNAQANMQSIYGNREQETAAKLQAMQDLAQQQPSKEQEMER